MPNPQTIPSPQDLLTREEIEAMKNECNEVEKWLLKKRCSCVDIRSENPACEPCKAIDLIENLFFIVEKYHALYHLDMLADSKNAICRKSCGRLAGRF